jgi:prevent-host-death family protein
MPVTKANKTPPRRPPAALPARRRPPMKRVGLTELKRNLAAYVRRAQKAPLLITRYGTPVAVMMSVAEYERLTRVAAQTAGHKRKSRPGRSPGGGRGPARG